MSHYILCEKNWCERGQTIYFMKIKLQKKNSKNNGKAGLWHTRAEHHVVVLVVDVCVPVAEIHADLVADEAADPPQRRHDGVRGGGVPAVQDAAHRGGHRLQSAERSWMGGSTAPSISFVKPPDVLFPMCPYQPTHLL